MPEKEAARGLGLRKVYTPCKPVLVSEQAEEASDERCGCRLVQTILLADKNWTAKGEKLLAKRNKIHSSRDATKKAANQLARIG